MFQEIDKDARHIEELQQEVFELKERCSSNFRCVVALEEETRYIKSQQTKDYTHIMGLEDNKAIILSDHERSLIILQKDVSILKDQLIYFNKVLKDIVSTVDKIKPNSLPKNELSLVEKITGIKKLLLPMHRCPNIWVLQAKAFITQELQRKEYFCESACWLISVQHVQHETPFHMEDRAIVRTYLSDNMQHRNGWKSCYFKTLVPAFTPIAVYHEQTDDENGVITNVLQPTLIEFYS